MKLDTALAEHDFCVSSLHSTTGHRIGGKDRRGLPD
jgi:hypothetical protein